MDHHNIAFVECTEGYEESAEVIRKAFLTVAKEFNITKENAPSNGAFIKADAIEKLAAKGIKLFDVFKDGARAGFFALEDAGEGVYYLEKLSVIPEQRHSGLGSMIMDFAADYVRRNSGSKISIAIVEENSVLKKWYLEYGFKELRLKKFEHLPFTVCFMELTL